MSDDDTIVVSREWLDQLLEEIVALKVALDRLQPKLVAELEELNGRRVYQRLVSRTPWETHRTG